MLLSQHSLYVVNVLSKPNGRLLDIQLDEQQVEQSLNSIHSTEYLRGGGNLWRIVELGSTPSAPARLDHCVTIGSQVMWRVGCKVPASRLDSC